jgi:hypothetical protein
MSKGATFYNYYYAITGCGGGGCGCRCGQGRCSAIISASRNSCPPGCGTSTAGTCAGC